MGRIRLSSPLWGSGLRLSGSQGSKCPYLLKVMHLGKLNWKCGGVGVTALARVGAQGVPSFWTTFPLKQVFDGRVEYWGSEG